MRLTATVKATFSAAHRLENHTVCGRVHGHAWTVWVTVEGSLRPKAYDVVDHGELAAELAAVTRELDNEDLGDMLDGVIHSPTGLCLYIRERLVLKFPNVTVVEVLAEPVGYSARVEWPLR